MEEVLLYNLDNEKGRRIRQLCAAMRIKVRVVDRADYLEPVGAVAGIPGVPRTGAPFAGPSFLDEMMVFKGFTDQALQAFLSRYRQAGIGKVDLKAGLTPYNIMWNSFQLRDELRREHEEMTRLEREQKQQKP